MIIYQMHPNHGRHKAFNNQEAVENNANGWETVSEEEFYAGILKKVEIIEETDESDELSEREKLSIRYEMKFGKKPSHLMKDETIQKKLDE